MSYEKTTWVDDETPISAENLNKMEQGIEDAAKTGGILEGSIVGYEGDTIPEGYEEVSNPYMTKIYSSNTFASSGELSESIDNFYGILLVSHFSTYNVKGSIFLPSEIAAQTNIPVKVHDNASPSSIRGVNVIISNGGKTLQITQFDSASHLMSVYGIFRK